MVLEGNGNRSHSFSSLRQTRKDIYDDKMKCYLFCALGGVFIGFGIADSDKVYFCVAGIVIALVGIYYYVRSAKK